MSSHEDVLRDRALRLKLALQAVVNIYTRVSECEDEFGRDDANAYACAEWRDGLDVAIVNARAVLVSA